MLRKKYVPLLFVNNNYLIKVSLTILFKYKKKGEVEDGVIKEKKERKNATSKKKSDGLKQTKLKFDGDGKEVEDGNLSDSPPPPPRTVSKRQAGNLILSNI